MSDPETQQHHPRPGLRPGQRQLALAAAGLLALGAAGGAAVMAQTRPTTAMAPVAPIAIRTLPSSGIVTVRGRVVEVYGNKFILADASGRMLVDSGREGDRRTLVSAGEPVTVQGRFDRGFIHAAYLVGPDSTVLALEPFGPPGGPHGPDHGPDGPPPPAGNRPGAMPPPPPPAVAAPAPTTAPVAPPAA